MFFCNALEEGFLWATFYRTIGLIWNGHPNAKSTYALTSLLSIMTVLLANILFLGLYPSYSSLLHHDEEEGQWGIWLLWTLVLQVQTMMIQSCSFSLYAAINKGSVNVIANLVAFYAMAL